MYLLRVVTIDKLALESLEWIEWFINWT